MIDLSSRLTQAYLAESTEHLVSLEADLLAMEGSGSQVDPDVVNRAFRAVHTIKGGAGFFDLTRLPLVAHRIEDVLGLIRSGKMIPTPDRIQVLLSATDILRDMVLDLALSDQVDTIPIFALLDGLCPSSQGSAVDPRLPATGRDVSRPYILLAEDDFSSRILLQAFLSRYGQCHVASNGREAVEAFASARERGQAYSLICMDIMMPEMDGQTAVRKIREMEEADGTLSSSGCRIIMTTALNDVQSVVDSFRSLCDAYLIKPVDLSQLLTLIDDLHLDRPPG